LRDNFWQQICTAYAGSHERERAGPWGEILRNAKGSLRQDSLCSQHIVGEKLSGFREVTSPPPALDQQHTKLTFDVGNVLGHCWLADTEILRRAGEGMPAGESREGPKSRFKSHNCSIYHSGKECILVLLRSALGFE
jgi:hypothetical protein